MADTPTLLPVFSGPVLLDRPGPFSLGLARRLFAHHLRLAPSHMHVESFERYDALAAPFSFDRAGRRLALAAPRGAAKSTVHTLVMPLLDIALAREKYIVIISATLAQAVARLRNMKSELRANPALTAEFPALGDKAEAWSRSSICLGGVRIDAFGAGSEIRGISHGPARPTKIILDDAEAGDLAATAAGRAHAAEWYNEVVENLGDSYTHVEVVGTILHRESLLSSLLTRPGFDAGLYRSVEEWSRRSDLWDEWRGILRDAANPGRMDAAAAFAAAHRDAMLEGTRVLWPEKEDYMRLMLMLETRGQRAFFKEKQNEPLDDASRMFRTAEWRRFVLAGGRLLDSPSASVDGALLATRDELVVVGFLDPAFAGKPGSRRTDFAAIATVGRKGGEALFLLDLWMERASPSAQTRRVFELHEEWGYAAFGFESNAGQAFFQEDLAAEAARRKAAGLRFDLPFHGENHSKNKKDRIAMLEGTISGSRLLFSRRLPEEFLAQADEFPNGPHDDGLDALAAAVKLADRTGGGVAPFRRSIPRESSRATRDW